MKHILMLIVCDLWMAENYFELKNENYNNTN